MPEIFARVELRTRVVTPSSTGSRTLDCSPEWAPRSCIHPSSPDPLFLSARHGLRPPLHRPSIQFANSTKMPLDYSLLSRYANRLAAAEVTRIRGNRKCVGRRITARRSALSETIREGLAQTIAWDWNLVSRDETRCLFEELLERFRFHLVFFERNRSL